LYELGSVTTTTPFTAQDTNGIAVTITNQLGTSATASGVTGGDLFVNIENVHFSPATFAVGDTLTITEDGGTGVANATVTSVHEGKKIGAIATQNAFNTDNPFTASDTSGVAVTFSYNAGVTTQQGSGLAGTATVAGPDLLDSVQLTSFGQGFMVGDIIDVNEDGGVGLGHITVTAIQ